MASEQISQNEFIAQAIAEATRVAIQTMAMTGMARQENPGIKMGGAHPEAANIQLERRGQTSMKSCKTLNLK